MSIAVFSTSQFDWVLSMVVGLCCPHLLSPFIIITHQEADTHFIIIWRVEDWFSLFHTNYKIYNVEMDVCTLVFHSSRGSDIGTASLFAIVTVDS